MRKAALSLVVVAASGAYVWSQWDQRPGEPDLGLALASDDVETGSVDPVDPPAPPDAPQPATIAEAHVGVSPAKDSIAVSAPSEPAHSPAQSDPPQVTDEAPPALSVISETPRDDDPPAPPAPRSMPELASSPVTTAASEPLETASLAPPREPAQTADATEPAPAAPPAPDPATPTAAEPAPPVILARQPRPRPNYVPPPAPPTPPTATVATAGTTGARLADGRYDGPAINAYYGFVQTEAVVADGRLADVRVLNYPKSRLASVFINRRALPRLRKEAIRAQASRVDVVSGATLTSEAFVRSLDDALQQARS